MTKPVLGIDSSGKTASVCVCRAGQMVYQKVLDEGLTHSETLLPLVAEALDAAGCGVQDLGRVVVTMGPGSFTGLRIGMALAKGLVLPFATPAVPVSTLVAYAHAAWAQGVRGMVVPALDARRGEVYWAAFLLEESGVQRLAPDAAGPLKELAPVLEGGARPVHFVGDGAELCYNKYQFAQTPAPGRLCVAAGAVLAARHMQAVPAGQMQPQYLRLSQAQRQRQQALQAKEEKLCPEP